MFLYDCAEKSLRPAASLSSVLASSKPTVQQIRPFNSNDETLSKRAAFKATPVDPKLLEYIERIGVGFSQKSKSTKRPRRAKGYSRKHDTMVLDTKEELDFFRQRTRNIAKERRSRKKPTRDAPASPSSWLPPPPFASTPDQGA